MGYNRSSMQYNVLAVSLSTQNPAGNTGGILQIGSAVKAGRIYGVGNSFLPITYGTTSKGPTLPMASSGGFDQQTM
jgi:hypothetical protein